MIVEDDLATRAVTTSIDLNPGSVRIVGEPVDYHWSSSSQVLARKKSSRSQFDHCKKALALDLTHIKTVWNIDDSKVVSVTTFGHSQQIISANLEHPQL